MPKRTPNAEDRELDEAAMNPTNLAGARRLMENPDLLDEALKRGLGAKGFTETEIKKLKRDAGGYSR